MAVEKTRQELTQPMLDMPFALVRRTDQAAITDMTDLNGKTLAIIGGWSILPVLKQRFPDIRIKTMSSIRDALQAVRKGTAAAAIDAEIVLSQTLLQQYMTDLTLDNNVPQLKDLPHALHIRVRPDLAPLKAILDQAITAMPLSSREFLRKKWFAESEMTSPAKMSVVPYRHLQKLTRSGRDLEKVELVNLNASQMRTVTVQAGVYGEHEFTGVTHERESREGLERHAGLWLNNERTWSRQADQVDGRHLTVILPASTSIRLSCGMRRFQHRPTYAFPWA